jgi:hypothetical protein
MLSDRTKNILLRVFRAIYRTVAITVCVVVFWLGAAFALPYLKVNSDRKPVKDGIEIFVKSNGVHTDFVLPSENKIMSWKALFPARTFEKVDSSSQWLAFGWGDKGFFLDTPTWAELKFSTAFKAAFWLGSSAMHLTYQKNILKINHPGYGTDDNFYEANGVYNLTKTCNVWTGEGLKSCGYPVGFWTPLDKGIIDHLP